ncbi:hypothetical protein G3O08_01560 [Cryomorpha ignava]|uniref:Uncharacterized protein n=1 Tax=Cryomorpha ignava TaxID=101383 RepID=A0A7K3WKM6_9FLAO|nr:hypothetical protein [Cryomorpha ignava]NEN22189.1 hypothetical protein [Cryomorpha ignava]
MIKKMLLIVFIGASLASCTNEETEQELAKLREENKALSQEVTAKDSTLKLFEESFTTIQRNLGLISEREKEISLNSELEESPESRDEITRDIQAINNLLQENKSTIDNLKSRVSKYGTQTAGFKKMIDQLSSDIDSKEEEISYLKENLTAANFTIEILNEMLDSAEFRTEIQSDMIAMQSNELNTAYYAMGTFKDLKDNGVLEKDGTVIGLGGTKQLKDNFNKDFFAKVDITKFTSLALNAEDVKLVTVHPEGSYTLEGENEKVLKITKPIEFWSTSKYLVIETK